MSIPKHLVVLTPYQEVGIFIGGNLGTDGLITLTRRGFENGNFSNLCLSNRQKRLFMHREEAAVGFRRYQDRGAFRLDFYFPLFRFSTYYSLDHSYAMPRVWKEA